MWGRVSLVAALVPFVVVPLGLLAFGGRLPGGFAIIPAACFLVAIGATIYAFYSGDGRGCAFCTYVIISLQLVLGAAAAMESTGIVPFIITLAAVASLGAYGVIRARRPAAELEVPAPTASSARPTSAPVTVNDVVGRWQYYVDALSRTVTIHFHEDGTYTETITDNRGDSTRCQGGTWSLSGANVELTDYVAADERTIELITWRMIDTLSGLRLYGGDDPDSFFCMTKVPLPPGESS